MEANLDLDHALGAVARTYVYLALLATGGDRKRAADLLAIPRSRLYRLLDRHPDVARLFPAEIPGRPPKADAESEG